MFGADLFPPVTVEAEKCPAAEDRVGALFPRILCLAMLSDDERVVVVVAERVLVVVLDDATLGPIPGIGAGKGTIAGKRAGNPGGSPMFKPLRAGMGIAIGAGNGNG